MDGRAREQGSGNALEVKREGTVQTTAKVMPQDSVHAHGCPQHDTVPTSGFWTILESLLHSFDIQIPWEKGLTGWA